jgi:hypothetical protein
LIAVLFVTKSNIALASKDNRTSLYVASYIPGPWSESSNSTVGGITEGNIVLANPTNNSLNDLNMTIQVDSSETIVPSLRLWDSNYTLNTPDSFMQSVYLFEDLQNFSTPITSISIEANQNETISLVFPSPESFQFSNHSLTIYVSKYTFGDIINGQLLIVPQTQAYLQLVKYGSVETDDTYHLHYDASYGEDMMILDNPNFFQRYHNETGHPIYPDLYGLARAMDVLGDTYFNVTVFNNSTFPVDSVALQGQISFRGNYTNHWGALIDYVMQPNETYLFPVAEHELPSYAYVTGYVIDNSAPASSTATPTVSELLWLAIVIVLVGILSVVAILRHRKKTKPNQ